MSGTYTELQERSRILTEPCLFWRVERKHVVKLDVCDEDPKRQTHTGRQTNRQSTLGNTKT
ncbi:hypothetical protein E2C01_073364 [Portunus trituberculatus]|uniref:Uncharacterized protein n=1 Tax=Portunus trituberculatus TaxID=210409 RepID=A0A5B7I558_PORTR|nr:hypothetical protein [Portunus trituberculatus]